MSETEEAERNSLHVARKSQTMFEGDIVEAYRSNQSWTSEYPYTLEFSEERVIEGRVR